MLDLSIIYLELYVIARFLLASYIRDLTHKAQRSETSGVWHLDNLRKSVFKHSSRAPRQRDCHEHPKLVLLCSAGRKANLCK